MAFLGILCILVKCNIWEFSKFSDFIFQAQILQALEKLQNFPPVKIEYLSFHLHFLSQKNNKNSFFYLFLKIDDFLLKLHYFVNFLVANEIFAIFRPKNSKNYWFVGKNSAGLKNFKFSKLFTFCISKLEKLHFDGYFGDKRVCTNTHYKKVL